MKKNILGCCLCLLTASLWAQSFQIRKSGEKYLLDIPDTLLGREIYLGTRVVDISQQKNISAGQTFYNPDLLRFRRQGKYILWEDCVSNGEWTKDNPFAGALEKNNTTPVGEVFEIAQRDEQGRYSSIDITKYFTDEVAGVCPLPAGFKQGKLETKISGIQGFWNNEGRVNIATKYYYSGGKEPFAVTIMYSLALADKPMAARLDDERIGMATVGRIQYDGGTADKLKYVTRWRIEPKPEDEARHRRGEMVVPKKPIVFYMDPNVPELVARNARLGILDWNAAFEAIGFREAIQVRDYPKNDPLFHPEDMLTNCFRYVPTTDANAMGATLSDPRSGEIIQGDIFWYHNVVNLLTEWRFAQTAAADPRIRTGVLDETLLGELIRYAVAHEMGHVLGFQHNMKGSAAYSVEQLKSPDFTQRYGTTASIMDYARNNFVANEADFRRGVSLLPPKLGDYDIFSVKWAYSKIYGASSPTEELPMLNRFFVDKTQNPKSYFGKISSSAIAPDPSAQSDMLGNDPLKAARYGVENVKFILKNIMGWVPQTGQTYGRTENLYDATLKQYYKLLFCVASHVAGVYYFPGTHGQWPAQYVPEETKKRKEALDFLLQRMLTDMPELCPTAVARQLGPKQETVLKRNADLLTELMSTNQMNRLNAYPDIYSPSDFLSDMSRGLFAPDLSPRALQVQALQMLYVDLLLRLSQGNKESSSSGLQAYALAARQQMLALKKQLSLLAQNKAHEGYYSALITYLNEK